MIASAAERFAVDLDGLMAPEERLGIAVSGGPDSLALMRLAHALRPGAIEAATVDHALRDGSRAEAEQVAATCDRMGIPHAILTVRWISPPVGNIQSRARAERYALLGNWAAERGIDVVATAHHADDQAETLLMRLARGSGVKGLGGARPRRALTENVALVRPLLAWRKAELAAIVAEAGLSPVDDPANRDDRHDRTRARHWLARSDLDPQRLASAAAHLREADEALDWSLGPLLAERITEQDGVIHIDPTGLPREYRRRLLLAAFARLGAPPPRGPDLTAAIDRLGDGATMTLAGLKLEGGRPWRVSRAPPRRAG